MKSRAGSTRVHPPDRGVALEVARSRDRAWRDARSEAMQQRIDRAFEAERLGNQCVRWGWLGAFGSLCALFLWAAGRDLFQIWRLEGVGGAGNRVWLATLTLALAAIPLGRGLRILARAVRRRLVRQAVKDELDVWDPA